MGQGLFGVLAESKARQAQGVVVVVVAVAVAECEVVGEGVVAADVVEVR